MPRYRSSRRSGRPSTATGTARRTTRRVRKLSSVVRPSLPELGLYRTVAELADVTPFPDFVLWKWIRQKFIKPIWYKGALYLSKQQFYSWYRLWKDIPIFEESLWQDFGYPVILKDGKYRRWYSYE